MTARQAFGMAVLIAAAVTTGVALSKKPWDVVREQQAAAEQQRLEMIESEARRAEWLRQEAEVRSSVGRERIARKAGFLKAGEEPVEK